jgi:signal peptidase II
MMALALFVVFAAVVGLDQVSKLHAQKTLLVTEYEGKDVNAFIPRKVDVFKVGDRGTSPYLGLKFNYSRNTGAAFSMLADLPDHIRIPFFYAVTVVAVFIIALYLLETPLNFHATRVGLIMVLAGAIGNFLDRVQRGYVIDFIDVDWHIFGWYHDFAIFNIADVAINIGVILLIGEMLLRHKKAT